MQINVLFFATLRDLAGTKEIQLTLPYQTVTVDELREELSRRYPQMAESISTASLAVNEEFAFSSDVIVDGAEVALFPPVSGGIGQADLDRPEVFRLPDSPIDHDEIIAAITIPETGAVCLFSGMVRGRTEKDGHIPETDYLEYEAYTPMALSKMKQVAQEIRELWPMVQGIAIVQRVGRLKVSHNTVLIACSAAHRDDGCFEAARYGIDRLKEIVPVWKKEIGPSGEIWIEGDYRPRLEDRNENS